MAEYFLQTLKVFNKIFSNFRNLSNEENNFTEESYKRKFHELVNKNCSNKSYEYEIGKLNAIERTNSDIQENFLLNESFAVKIKNSINLSEKFDGHKIYAIKDNEMLHYFEADSHPNKTECSPIEDETLKKDISCKKEKEAFIENTEINHYEVSLWHRELEHRLLDNKIFTQDFKLNDIYEQY